MEIKTYKEIKKIVGDGWAFIANPTRKNNSVELESGILLFHDKDKQKVIEASLKIKDKKIKVGTIHYCGKIPDQVILL